MYELFPYYTNDGSIGLFSPEADDIYHSTNGALSEAYEKFILPSGLESYFKINQKIKILDICFGIGYNTKSILNFLIENKILKNNYNDTIYTNNNFQAKYNEKIDGDNDKLKIYIHAIDNDKILPYLSPFFKTYEKNIQKINLKSSIAKKQEKIKRMLTGKAFTQYKLKKEVNIILLKKIFEDIPPEIDEIITDRKYKIYFDKNMIDLWHLYLKSKRNITPFGDLYTFLHNIYYKYLSACYKMAVKALKLLDFNFNLEIEDARFAVKNDKNTYNFIFLDAFTPSKCPCLWTVDFFKLLYGHLDENGMILTYSNSANIRNAFLNAGFYVGKIFLESSGKFTGTVAVKNKSLIKYDLSEYDLGLMKTRAGIFYRDENLNLDNESIIKAHKIEVENSNLMSSTKYIRNAVRYEVK